MYELKLYTDILYLANILDTVYSAKRIYAIRRIKQMYMEGAMDDT